MRKEKAGQERVVNPEISGCIKGASEMPEIWEVVSIMRTRTVVVEEGISRSGGGLAMMVRSRTMREASTLISLGNE